jgi:hypothetical protein
MRSSILLASVCIFLLGPSAIRPAFAAEAYWRCAVGRVVVVTNSSGARCERLLRAALRYEQVLMDFTGLEADTALPPLTLYSLTRDDAKRLIFKPEELEEQKRSRSYTHSKYMPSADDVVAVVVDQPGDEPLQSALFMYGQGMLSYQAARSYPAWYQLGIANLLNGLIMKPDGTVLLNRNPMFMAAVENGKRPTERLDLPKLLDAVPQNLAPADFNELASRAHAWALFGVLTTPERRERYRELAMLMRQGTPAAEAVQEAFGKPLPELQAEFEANRWRTEVSYRLEPPASPLPAIDGPTAIPEADLTLLMEQLKQRATS